MPRLCLSDTTPEALGRLMAAHPKGLLFYRDELSGLLGGFDRYGGGGAGHVAGGLPGPVLHH